MLINSCEITTDVIIHVSAYIDMFFIIDYGALHIS